MRLTKHAANILPFRRSGEAEPGYLEMDLGGEL